MLTLFDETKISKMNLKNRFICSAIYEGWAVEKGHVTDELINHYENLAKGGVSTIITGFAKIMKFDQPAPNMNVIYDDIFIDEYQELTNKIHEHDTNIIMQIVHGGPKWGPSAVEHLVTKTIPKEMNKEDIKEVIQAFADAALRVKKAGFDGVQIHAAHGFLLSMFLNPYYNKRTDEYGGSIENRGRIIFESYEAIREIVGDDFPVLVKVNCEDFMDEGLNFSDSLIVCDKLSKMGIDAIEVSGGSYSSKEGEGPIRGNVEVKENESYFKEYAAKIAEMVQVPVILVGGNRSFNIMTEILNNTNIEYFSLARPFICEPDLIDRWLSGDKDPAQCKSCDPCSGVNNCIQILN
ncbi:MAG: NADH:flavin oxidoreductase [Methanobacterium sp.]|jgi:2,4-dienoyl-CoA reductase-like NADH-dependent reductase (Old Yellow Enzyme family)